MWELSPERDVESLFKDCYSSHDDAPTKVLYKGTLSHPICLWLKEHTLISGCVPTLKGLVLNEGFPTSNRDVVQQTNIDPVMFTVFIVYFFSVFLSYVWPFC